MTSDNKNKAQNTLFILTEIQILIRRGQSKQDKTEKEGKNNKKHTSRESYDEAALSDYRIFGAFNNRNDQPKTMNASS